MNVLVACEESQRVCTAFRRRGHNAFSCDLMEPSGGHPEWHILGDCLPLLNGRCEFQTMDGESHAIEGRWDMIIAFPPCTKTSNAGARHLWAGGVLNIVRYYEGLCGKALFMAIKAADCEKVVIENPKPSSIYDYPEPQQKIHPYEFDTEGEHPWTKLTLLWEKGVKPLEKTTPEAVPKGPYIPSGTGRKLKGITYGAAKRGDDSRERSKTPIGLANAMAEQWG